MRILLMNDAYGPRGATSAIVRNLAEAYKRQSHDVRILATHRRETSSAIIRNGNVTSIPVSYRPSLRHYRCLRMPAVSKMLKEEIGHVAPDVVHAHNVHTFLTYDALRIAARATPRIYLTMHDVMSFAFARVSTPRFLASGGTDARLHWTDHLREAGLQWNPFRNAAIRRVLRGSVRETIAVSDALRQALIQNGVPCRIVIPNAIDSGARAVQPSAVQAWKEARGIAGRPTILFGGRLSRDKGVFEILRTMHVLRNALPDILLLVTGDWERWERIVRQTEHAEELRANLLCTGWLSRDEMSLAFAAANVATTPSLCLDAFPTMNLEAMAAGKPVVGTIFGGTKEIVVHGETGFVCDPRDTATYAEYLLRLLKDPALAARMGEAGRKRVEKHYTVEKQADAYLKLFAT